MGPNEVCASWTGSRPVERVQLQYGTGFSPCPDERARRFLNGRKPLVEPATSDDMRVELNPLLARWMHTALESQARSQDFNAFIHAWIALNGWASTCCNDDSDRAQLSKMMLNERIAETANAVMAENSQAVENFAGRWPIFRAWDLAPGARQTTQHHTDRRIVVSIYEDERPSVEREPGCNLRHPGRPPADWPHTLDSLYRVRCNLFHGQKSVADSQDKLMVKDAVAVLLPIAQALMNLDRPQRSKIARRGVRARGQR